MSQEMISEKSEPLVGAGGPRTSFKVHAENLDALRDRVADLNKRVARLRGRGYDVAFVHVKIGELYVEKYKQWDESGFKQVERERVYANVELLSPKPPKIDGWQFVAALTHVEDVGTVLRVCPGAEVAEGELWRYREASSENCDHCRVARRRNDTFVIRDRGGELRQVGRQCLAAYTGLANPEALCACAEILFAVSDALSLSEDDEPGDGRGGGGRQYASIAAYLPYVACSIRVDGWLSRGASRQRGDFVDRSTATLALVKGLFATPDTSDPYEPEERDYNLASATLEHCEAHFAGCDVAALSDYENSLRVAMASGILSPKLTGLVASAITFYQRDVERRARNEAWAEMVRRSRHQGVVGERRVFEDLRVLACRTWQSDFGATHFYAFVDPSGNAFAYFASRDLYLEPGQVVSLKATVKRHEMRTPKLEAAQAYAQTTLTRCALVTRARVVSCEAVEKDLGKRVVTNPDRAPGVCAEYTFELEKVNLYHLEGSDGRRFVYQSRSRKRGLVPGAVALVEYDAEDLSSKHAGERPVSLVGLVDQGECQLGLLTAEQGGQS